MRYRDLTVYDLKSPKKVAHFPARDGQQIFMIDDGYFLRGKRLCSLHSNQNNCFAR